MLMFAKPAAGESKCWFI